MWKTRTYQKDCINGGFRGKFINRGYRGKSSSRVEQRVQRGQFRIEDLEANLVTEVFQEEIILHFQEVYLIKEKVIMYRMDKNMKMRKVFVL